MMQRFTSFLPFRRSQETGADSGADEAGYESTGSDGTYADCLSEDEQKQISSDGVDESKKSPQSSATHNSVDPPVSSGAVAAAELAPGLVEDGSSTELDPVDDFVQTSPLLETVGSQKNSAPPKGGPAPHKNDLQIFCQRSRIEMPTYRHEKVGPDHALDFQATVEVDGKVYKSDGQYSTKVGAEQAAAEAAVLILCPGLSSVRGSIARSKGQVRTGNRLSVATPLDLPMDEDSRSLASISHQQSSGVISNGVAALRGLQLSRGAHVPGFQNLARNQPTVPWPDQTDHLASLGKLNFSTHAFPLLTRLNGLPLEEVYTLDEIEDLQTVPAGEVNEYLWNLDSRKRPSACRPQSRVQTDDPELLLYDCYVNSEGKRFVASINHQGTTLLQRQLGFDKVLRVFFEGMVQDPSYGNIFKGIFVGNRFYQYLVHKFKDDKLTNEEKKETEGPLNCYFVCTDSLWERDLNDTTFERFSTIAQARLRFMHVHSTLNVPKCIARLQLFLSKTKTIRGISLSEIKIEELDDIPSTDTKNLDASFTDGTGFISTDLAKLVPRRIFQGMCMRNEEGQGSDNLEKYPCLLQIRFFHNGVACKGTLLANKKLPPKTIRIFKSMKKVERDPTLNGFSISSFELVSTSRRPRRADLSQDLIVLLSIGGVEESVFLDAVRNAIEDVLDILRDFERAYKEVLLWEWESNVVDSTRRMLKVGIPLEEPALQQNLQILIHNKMKYFAKGKVPLDGTFYLMGTADPSGTLKPNEVVIYKDGILVSGPAIVYRAPGKHPSDPHPVKAVNSQALEEYVGGEKNAIFFSTQGTRPLPHEIAKGDLDGDLYWICVNEKVVEQFKPKYPPWSTGHVQLKGSDPKPLKELSSTELENAMRDEYFRERFHPSGVIGIASYRWLNHVDAYLNADTSPKDKEMHWQEILKYPDYIYAAIDMSKSGKQVKLFSEHDLLKRYYARYLSKNVFDKEKGGNSILGKIFDLAQVTPQAIEDVKIDSAFQFRGSEKYVKAWTENFNAYRKEMSRASNSKDPVEQDRVRMKYKEMLYGAPSFCERKKDTDTVLAEASAIYQVVYKKAGQDLMSGNEVRLSFAWNVAVEALVFIYAEKKGEYSIWTDSAYDEVHKRKKRLASAPRGTLS